MSANKTKWVRLGEYIELCDERNSEGKYKIDDVKGMTITKEIIPTKADLKENDLSKFLVVKPREFVYNPRTHGKKIGLGFNNTSKAFIISWNNIAFRIIDKNILLPEYLYMIICREEWDRSACFRSWGSSTEVFSWSELCRMEIPLPSISIQRELVNTYNGLKSLAEDNEALIAPLTQACEALVVDCKRKYDEVTLGEYIEEVILRVGDRNDYFVSGINMTIGFVPTVANMANIDISKYKVVPKQHFACNLMHVGRDITIPIAYNDWADNIAVSPAYYIFHILDDKKENLSPLYLSLILGRKEFGRLAWFHTIGSVRGNLPDKTLKEIKIPLPPPDVQQSIVNLYHCIEEAKRIAAEARKLMRTLCPALIQKAIHC